MKIKKFEVKNLNKTIDEISMEFKGDLNILTGRNGCGKTTILKALWYLVSSNIPLLIKEIQFSEVRLDTESYNIEIKQNNSGKLDIIYQDYISTNINIDEKDISVTHSQTLRDIERYIQNHGSSIFLPTFRRIEGGFSINSLKRHRFAPGLEDSLSVLSSELSKNAHLFITSLSTLDIESLLTKKYSELADECNKKQKDISEEIIKDIKEKKQMDDVELFLEKIKDKVETMEEDRKNIMYPFDVLKDLVIKLFQHSGIKLTSFFSLGNATSAINSNLLSAGEKQLLSFIAYNTFYQNTIFIIDEPELSLHIDWQRILFPTLLEQGMNNQFIIATHSPFIYSKYPDKELQIIPDRGHNE